MPNAWDAGNLAKSYGVATLAIARRLGWKVMKIWKVKDVSMYNYVGTDSKKTDFNG